MAVDGRNGQNKCCNDEESALLRTWSPEALCTNITLDASAWDPALETCHYDVGWTIHLLGS